MHTFSNFAVQRIVCPCFLHYITFISSVVPKPIKFLWEPVISLATYDKCIKPRFVLYESGMWSGFVFIFAYLCTSTALSQTHVAVGQHVTIQVPFAAVRKNRESHSAASQV